MSHRLIIAEKPSLAAKIAGALSEIHGVPARQEGQHWRVGPDVVAAAAGHLAELYSPENYNKDLKQWRMADLPIVPPDWRYAVKDTHMARFSHIKKLLAEASEVVSAGDPDNEGSSIVTEILDLCKWRKGYKRAWWSGETQSDLVKGFRSLKPQSFDEPIVRAQKARSWGDWLVGMNGTRAWTLVGRNVLDGVLSVGRVQTPTLNMVVQRELAIRNFKSTDYFELYAEFHHAKGSVKAKWDMPEELKDPVSGYLTDRSVVDKLSAALSGKTGTVSEFTAKNMKKAAPKPMAQSDIAARHAGRLGLTVAEMLEVCQLLYSEYELGSYPRTSSNFFSDDEHTEAPAVMAAIANNAPELAALVKGANLRQKHEAFDTDKLTKAGSHPALRPTTKHCPLTRLKADAQRLAASSSRDDKKKARLIEAGIEVYRLYALSFIALFYPETEWKALSVAFQVAAGAAPEVFRASGRMPTKVGWKAVYGELDDEDDDAPPLPEMAKGDAAKVAQCEAAAKATKPPARFTESTLVKAMTTIASTVKDEGLRKLLRDADGIGTAATRAAILEGLKSREYISVDKKGVLTATDKAIALMKHLPDILKSPLLACIFENDIKTIERGEGDLDKFMAKVREMAKDLVEAAKKSDLAFAGSFDCPKCKTRKLARRADKKQTGRYYWSCPGYFEDKACTAIFSDLNGKPDFEGVSRRDSGPYGGASSAGTSGGTSGKARSVAGSAKSAAKPAARKTATRRTSKS